MKKIIALILIVVFVSRCTPQLKMYKITYPDGTFQIVSYYTCYVVQESRTGLSTPAFVVHCNDVSDNNLLTVVASGLEYLGVDKK